MARRVVVRDDRVGKFIAEELGVPYHREDTHAIGVVDDSLPEAESVLGGVLFYGQTPTAMWMHVASRTPRWVTHDMLAVCFHFPFVQCRCEHLYGLVEETNHVARIFDRHVGFKEIARLPGMFASGDGLVVHLPRSGCRYLGMRLRTLNPGRSEAGG